MSINAPHVLYQLLHMICKNACLHVRMHACMHACVCMCVCLCVYLCVEMLACGMPEIVCVCMCMHKHMRAQQTQMHVFFVMCFLTWEASAEACSSRAQGTPPDRQRDQRTAAGRVRPAHIASVSACPRKRSASPLAHPALLSSAPYVFI